MRVPGTADREFTASAYVVRDGRVLLIRHAKLGRWLQPGGHVEDRETPDEAAVREVREETGVEIRIHDHFRPGAPDSAGPDPASPDPAAPDIPQPFRVNLHEVRADHWHCDFAFLGVPVGASAPGAPGAPGDRCDRDESGDPDESGDFGESDATDEHEGQRWVSRAELGSLDPLDDATRRTAVAAIRAADVRDGP